MATLVGAVAVSVAVDPSREKFGRLAGEAVACASGLVIAMIVFTIATRSRRAKLTLPR
ncbi:hypothetical protein QD712_30250 [Streptomyces acidiscabies]|uniref:hypothetical protein n=1 Tax=Streptomyces acidiscabies TaxID=42234 RepID=UPI0030D3FC8D